MVRFIVRTIGLWLLAAAVVAGVVDGMKSIAASRVLMMSSGQFWATVSPGSLASAQGFVRRLAPALWDAAIVPGLQVPAWLVFLVIGILFSILGLRPKRTLVYAA